MYSFTGLHHHFTFIFCDDFLAFSCFFLFFLAQHPQKTYFFTITRRGTNRTIFVSSWKSLRGVMFSLLPTSVLKHTAHDWHSNNVKAACLCGHLPSLLSLDWLVGLCVGLHPSYVSKAIVHVRAICCPPWLVVGRVTSVMGEPETEMTSHDSARLLYDLYNGVRQWSASSSAVDCRTVMGVVSQRSLPLRKKAYGGTPSKRRRNERTNGRTNGQTPGIEFGAF